MPEVNIALSAEDRPATPAHLGEAAFFDVDNTLMKGASLFHVARKMYQKKAFTLRDAAGFAWKQAQVHPARRKHGRCPRRSRSRPKSWRPASPRKWSAPGRRSLRRDDRVQDLARHPALAEQHLHVGRQVWLVTATPIEVAGVISSRLGLTGALGTVAEVEDGLYTGRLVGEILHGPAKAVAVRELARRAGAGPGALLGLQRLIQRHPAADAGGPPGGHQPRRQAAPPRAGAQLAGLRLPFRPPGGNAGAEGRHRRRRHLRPVEGLQPHAPPLTGRRPPPPTVESALRAHDFENMGAKCQLNYSGTQKCPPP